MPVTRACEEVHHRYVAANPRDGFELVSGAIAKIARAPIGEESFPGGDSQA